MSPLMDVLSLSNESEEMGRAGGVVVLLIMLVVCVQVEVGTFEPSPDGTSLFMPTRIASPGGIWAVRKRFQKVTQRHSGSFYKVVLSSRTWAFLGRQIASETLLNTSIRSGNFPTWN